MNHKKTFVYTFILALLMPGYACAEDPIVLPPIKVIAPATDGGNIMCRGTGCLFALAATQGAYANHDNYLENLIIMEPGQVDREVFCSNLKKKQPRKCRLGSIPSTPIYDPGWQPNGCGTGAIANAAVSSLLGILFAGYYTLDEPYRGVSFEAACDMHDRCFSAGGGFDTCNNNFSIAMASSCAGGTVAGSNARFACGNYAAAYRAAVSTDKFDSTDISGDYAAFARALGGYGERVTEIDEIIPAIKRGIEETRKGNPVLLEFITCKETARSMYK